MVDSPLNRYLDAARQPDAEQAGAPVDAERGAAFDELAAPDGTPRPAWAALVDDLARATDDLASARREVARLLEDDNVTYTPSPTSAHSVADLREESGAAQPALEQPRPWRLDPIPLVLHDREWATLEAGVVQRAELLDAVLADLYGARRLLARGQLPPAVVLDHEEYLRPVVGAEHVVDQRLFMTAADLGRDATGAWKVISDRTQAPSGAGYAMQNRRVVSRVLPEIYHAAHLHRLTPFFQAMRVALVESAPSTVEDPRVVVLSPGTHSETAFDQAFVASLLGFPLLEGSDLLVRDGRVWMRVLGRLEQVDVILRRVDSTWMDALELRGGSRLGVTGLLECVRQGTVSVVNTIGSGVLENPALLPFLPDLCERLLGEPLRLPSVDTWWCGDREGLAYVRGHLDELVVRAVNRGAGRSVVGSALSRDQRERLLARIDAAPHRFVGQEVLPLSSAPTVPDDTDAGGALVRRSVVLRSFAVRSGSSYTAMLGGLARTNDEHATDRGALVTAPDGGVAKDVWVVSSEPVPASRSASTRSRADEGSAIAPGAAAAAMVPRVLSDLYWFGRYAERAEDLLRIVLVSRTVMLETDADVRPGHALDVLLRAVTHVSTTYPGFVGALGPDGSLAERRAAVMPELRSLLLDRRRAGSVAQSVAALGATAQGVRDQLSEDVWMVLADVERALGTLAGQPRDQGLHLVEAGERVLSGLLALTGIAGENMVRDPGWLLLDTGRGLERALQVLSLLRATLVDSYGPDVDRVVVEAALTSSESIVTFRRRYRGRSGVSAVLELMVLDPSNPRSVAYQLQRMQADLRAVPSTSPTARPLRLLDNLAEQVRTADPVALATVTRPDDGADADLPARRDALEAFCAELHAGLRDLSTAIRDQYHEPPPTQQSLPRQQALRRGPGAPRETLTDDSQIGLGAVVPQRFAGAASERRAGGAR
ncbi:circularly permuted type 2 ATP-grasp protein [Microlunatus flavus]|uniref:circularly permuted type 2 ATP-grasp protein n=1 Tax=Microlunatus flavus TaxID=1036181 RepID=UPI001E2E13AA|nr:circularly permuted type 2 ATP-grasp protein [Microlunatus flavus]